MLKKIITILLCSLCSILFAQKIIPYNGQYKNGQMAYVGQNWCPEPRYCFPIGFFTYWYENGQMELQTFAWFTGEHRNSNHRYINMWLSDGKQIMKDGTGIYYNITEDSRRSAKDSMIYEIKDSVKNGPSKTYRMYRPDNYFLVESGQYANGERTGKFKFRDTVLLIEEVTLYDHDNQIMDYKYLHENLQTREEGQKINWKKEGVWKYYGDDGTLRKEVTYANGIETGDIKIYDYDKKGKLKKARIIHNE